MPTLASPAMRGRGRYFDGSDTYADRT
jgi:hypothetical protein